MSKIILLSKDALGKFYLPIYGNNFWSTPNIDELAKKGTIFNRHYTAAPSSAMSYYSMFTGLFPMESNMSTYHIISEKDKFKGKTFFDKAYDLGYECHIIWDSVWDKTARLHSDCYGEHTIFDSIDGIRQPTGVHAIDGQKIIRDDDLAQETLKIIINKIAELTKIENLFLWVHIPHVIKGRVGYGSDIDLFDSLVGYIRNYFDDDCIFITSDHGNMNGSHGKLGYGFDVNEEAINIPLITPMIEGEKCINFPTSNVDLFELIFERKIVKREFVFSDSAYYAQLHRKLAIIYGDYKLIHSFAGNKDELFDVVYNPIESQNLFNSKQYDIDRKKYCNINELYFYPNWEEIDITKRKLIDKKNEIWKKPNKMQIIRAYYEKLGKFLKRKINLLKNKKHK